MADPTALHPLPWASSPNHADRVGVAALAARAGVERHHPMAVRCARRNVAGQPIQRVRFHRVRELLRRLCDRNAWMPANREDRDALMFAWGQMYMLCVCGGAWLLIHFL